MEMGSVARKDEYDVRMIDGCKWLRTVHNTSPYTSTALTTIIRNGAIKRLRGQFEMSYQSNVWNLQDCVLTQHRTKLIVTQTLHCIRSTPAGNIKLRLAPTHRTVAAAVPARKCDVTLLHRVIQKLST
jgi:hypothetical protein